VVREIRVVPAVVPIGESVTIAVERANEGKCTRQPASTCSRSSTSPTLPTAASRSRTVDQVNPGTTATRASVTGAMAVGARILGPSALGPLALAVAAVGALAVGRLAIADAVIRRLRAEEIEIGSLKVRELEVAGQRWTGSTAPPTPAADQQS
jgi:hypothetical protein